MNSNLKYLVSPLNTLLVLFGASIGDNIAVMKYKANQQQDHETILIQMIQIEHQSIQLNHTFVSSSLISMKQMLFLKN